MIQRMIEFSLKNRSLILLAYLVLAAWGYWALLRTPIDAIPDLSENQVIVFTDWPGRSPQEVEDQITYLLTVNLQGLAGIKTVRFGVRVLDDQPDLRGQSGPVFRAGSRAGEAEPRLGNPAGGSDPGTRPDATGVGQVYWYTVAGPYDPGMLHSLQHWFIRYQLNSVPGVAEVGTIGGFLREYQFDIDPVNVGAKGHGGER
jgi:Cu(I)/Ag(I) efflux system membrane protein CusA/SilA